MMAIPRLGSAPASALALLALIATAPAPPPPADEAAMDAWWADLEKDEAPAVRALLRFGDHRPEAVAFLQERLKPLTIDAEKVRALIDWLGNDDEAVWKPAFEELEYFDPRLAIDLETLIREAKEPPGRQRLVEVLSGYSPGTLKSKTVELRNHGQDSYNFFSDRGSWWAEVRVDRINSSGWGNTRKKWTRAIRAIVLLEHIRTPEAVALLKTMAGGRPDAQPTRAAKESLDRIARGQ